MTRPRRSSASPPVSDGSPRLAGKTRRAATPAKAGEPNVVYAYCVIRAETPPELDAAPAGMPGASRPRAVALAPGRFLILADAPGERYSEAAIERSLGNLAWVSACAVAHEQLIEHFLACPALLPMKLLTIFSSEAAAVAAMKRGVQRTTELLGRLAGHVECGVRVRFLGPPAEAFVPPASPGAGSGRAFLEAKKTVRDARRTALGAATAAVATLRQQLERGAAETRALEPPEGILPGGLLLDAAYLVPRDRVAAFEDVLAQHGGELQKLGCEIVLTGPWPAYHFLDGGSA